MFLLDTNVLSALRRLDKVPASVGEWAGRVELRQMTTSVISLQEIETGILLRERSDPSQGVVLRQWMTDFVLERFGARSLPVDREVALRCAQLHAEATRAELDALIAATALVHDLTLVTRNVRDFAGTGVRVLNPFDPSPKVQTP